MRTFPQALKVGTLVAVLICAAGGHRAVRGQPGWRASASSPRREGVVPASATARVSAEPPANALPTLAALHAQPRLQLPVDFTPWWQPHVTARLRDDAAPKAVDLDWLLINTLAHSFYVRAISQDVLIQETEILEAQSAFDAQAFLESKFVRTSEPVGSLLDTGGPPRLREEDWGLSGGWRKRNALGGSFEAAQRFGTRDSNSRFFVPPQQGNARLSLSFNQPLLNGAGRAYNTALIVLADIDTNAAMDRASEALQEHLLRVATAYWDLYLQRAMLLQKHQHVQRAAEILERMQQRRDLDTLQSQIVRARAAVATRRAELVQAAASIRNLEARLRSLTGAPELEAGQSLEILPQDRPARVPLAVSLRDAMATAVQNRPEIDAASQEIRAASVRLQMSEHELLPALDLVLETYVSGLQPELDMGRAWVDQFSVGEPSYTAGLVFEVPLGRRAARARLQRRQLQLRQLTQQFEQTMQTLLAEVEVAVRNVNATYQTLAGRYQALVAAEAETDYSTKRWLHFAGEDRAAGFLLEDLLDAQDRLASEESAFATAQRDYTLSLIELKRTTGTLLQHEQIYPIRTCCGGLPELHFEKATDPARPEDVLPAPQR